jgi:hypothetical protein
MFNAVSVLLIRYVTTEMYRLKNGAPISNISVHKTFSELSRYNAVHATPPLQQSS